MPPSLIPDKILREMSLTELSAIDIAKAASLASCQLATLSETDRNEALTALHNALLIEKGAILEANAKDIRAAEQSVEGGSLSHSVLKRLDLSRPGKYDDMLRGITSVRNLSDPSMAIALHSPCHPAFLIQSKSEMSSRELCLTMVLLLKK